ncbi:hypothetical protein A2U01_0103272, partial [Trifolium medium]|nr:hypothetical protein [Trifolium medium]
MKVSGEITFIHAHTLLHKPGLVKKGRLHFMMAPFNIFNRENNRDSIHQLFPQTKQA